MNFHFISDRGAVHCVSGVGSINSKNNSGKSPISVDPMGFPVSSFRREWSDPSLISEALKRIISSPSGGSSASSSPDLSAKSPEKHDYVSDNEQASTQRTLSMTEFSELPRVKQAACGHNYALVLAGMYPPLYTQTHSYYSS